jgi:hypothetical protein
MHMALRKWRIATEPSRLPHSVTQDSPAGICSGVKCVVCFLTRSLILPRDFITLRHLTMITLCYDLYSLKSRAHMNWNHLNELGTWDASVVCLVSSASYKVQCHGVSAADEGKQMITTTAMCENQMAYICSYSINNLKYSAYVTDICWKDILYVRLFLQWKLKPSI